MRGGWHGNFKKHLDVCKNSPVPINLNTGMAQGGGNGPGMFTPPPADDITIGRVVEEPMTAVQLAAAA